MNRRNVNIGLRMIFGLVFGLVSFVAKADPALSLVSARDHLPGSFLRDQTIYADHDRIYLVSFQGQIFVLSRDRSTNFPLVETISLGTPLVAVRGDESNLYVLSFDGTLRTFTKSFPLQLSSAINLPGYGGSSLALVENNLYFSTGQAEMAVDQNMVFLSQLSESDFGSMLSKDKFGTRPPIYGRVFMPGVTTVYDRQTGAMIGFISNPTGPGGSIQQVALFSDSTRLFQTMPGPFGAGIWIYNKSNLSLNRFVYWPYANAVAKCVMVNGSKPRGDYLLSGSESGKVGLFDLRQNQPLIGCVNLPLVTGHTNPEDIEIRALWCDGLDDLVFAGSSWGNSSSQGPDLPSFFVLEVR